jgi:ketosteroid isomerase-like protein
METYLEKIKDVYDMMAKGQLPDAFEKYYDKDVVMVEATGETRTGKDANRKFQQDFMGTIKEFHGMGMVSVTSNEGEKTSMIESCMDVTMADGNRSKMEEVAVVQKWSDGQIVHERFYYNAGKM